MTNNFMNESQVQPKYVQCLDLKVHFTKISFFHKKYFRL